MALGLRITDGTTTITLSNVSTTGVVTSYAPGAPNAAITEVIDKIRILLVGGTATIRGSVGTINKLLRQAETYQERRLGSRVWVERNLGDGVWWRSEILNGILLMDGQALDMGLAAGKMEVDLMITRRGYWEGAEVAIPLSNENGTGVTNGLTIYAVSDAQPGKDNWMDIEGADISGDLPAPIRIELTNTFDDPDETRTVIMALNRNSSPRSLQHTFEAENATAFQSDVLPAAPNYDLYSNGKYRTKEMNPDMSLMMYWTLDNDKLSKCKGNDFRVLLGTPSTPPAGTWVQLKTTIESLTLLQTTPMVMLDTDMFQRAQEIGTLKLPPYLYGSGTLGELRLELWAKRSPAIELAVDYLQILPLDGYRKIMHEGHYIDYGQTLSDNPLDDYLYVVWADGIRGYQVAYGEPIALEPGANQRLYIVTIGRDMALRTSSVKAWYRPRRLMI